MPYTDTEKQKEYKRLWHQKNKAQRREQARDRKETAKDEIRKLKEESACADCGVNYPFYMMQFDHVRGEKLGNISTFVSNRQFKLAWDEIQKCEIVCANCHAKRTYERQPKGSDDPRFIA